MEYIRGLGLMGAPWGRTGARSPKMRSKASSGGLVAVVRSFAEHGRKRGVCESCEQSPSDQPSHHEQSDEWRSPSEGGRGSYRRCATYHVYTYLA